MPVSSPASVSLHLDGVLRCSRYSFSPNRLHYCGPDANRELTAYLDEGVSDAGLRLLLSQFATLYPYLKLIAESNRIRDPFDARVVEAYWLGNALLDAVDTRRFHRHLIEAHGTKRKIGATAFGYLERKIGRGALPHHSFHVLNVWRRTGNEDVPHTLESMDACRVSSGRVLETNGPRIVAAIEPILYADKRLYLGAPVRTTLARRLESEYDIEQLQPGNLISVHWGVPCEVITEAQAENLRRFTLTSLTFANETL